MKKPGRNDSCPCGSGRKYKQCCQSRGQAPATMAPQGSAAGFDAIQTALGYFQAGQLAQAEAVCQQALSVSPRHPDVLHLAGMIAGQAGKREMAVELINKAIGIKPSGAMYYNLGSVLHDIGRLDEAIENYRKAIELAPHFVEAYCNLGLALTDQGRLDEAIEICRQALALRPDFVEAYNNMGNALRYQGKLEMAIACYRKALVLKPDLPEVCNNLGCALQEIGEVDEAIKSFHKALALRPNDAEAHIGLGWTHHDMGQFDTAKVHFDRAIALKPDHPVAWAALPSLQKMTVADSAWAEKAQRLLSGGVKLQEEMRLCYALGKYNNDVGRYGDAFLFYERANRLKRQLTGPFDRETFRRFIDAIIAAYPSGVVRQQRDGGSDSCRPLFIVGMPRSGTSLTEQILASHPDAFGAGELRFWAQQANGCLLAMPSRRYDPTLLQDIAKQYEDELQRHSSNALRVVDKMPDNFLYLGLIHAVFPRARILHTRRNPVDTCLSIYFQNFSSRHAYASDLDDLAFYYREYYRLMAHWRAVLPPEVLLDVPYEALVEDQEGWSRRIIEFVGLEWDERCLNFHETERKVGTASNWQVRQKIYKTSKERWRNYEKFVGSLLPLLELTA